MLKTVSGPSNSRRFVRDVSLRQKEALRTDSEPRPRPLQHVGIDRPRRRMTNDRAIPARSASLPETPTAIPLSGRHTVEKGEDFGNAIAGWIAIAKPDMMKV